MASLDQPICSRLPLDHRELSEGLELDHVCSNLSAHHRGRQHITRY